MDKMIPVIQDNIGPDSEFFKMHADYWKIVKHYINGNSEHIRNDDYWQEVVNTVEWFSKKYKSDYARKVMLVFLDELGKRDKAEKAANITYA